MCSYAKCSVRICSVPGCKNLTHNHRLLCDSHESLHYDPKDYSRDDQCVITLNVKASSAFTRIRELMQPRTYDNISREDFEAELVRAARVISENSGIDVDDIINYAAEYRKNAWQRYDFYERPFAARNPNVDWRN